MVEEYSDEEMEEILDRVYEWSVEFSKSQRYEALTEEQKQESEPVIMSFTEYMYSYHPKFSLTFIHYTNLLKNLILNSLKINCRRP